MISVGINRCLHRAIEGERNTELQEFLVIAFYVYSHVCLEHIEATLNPQHWCSRCRETCKHACDGPPLCSLSVAVPYLKPAQLILLPSILVSDAVGHVKSSPPLPMCKYLTVLVAYTQFESQLPHKQELFLSPSLSPVAPCQPFFFIY